MEVPDIATGCSSRYASTRPRNSTRPGRMRSGSAAAGTCAGALAGLALVAYRTGDYPAASRAYDEAVAAYRVLGDQGGVAMALRMLAQIDLNHADYALAQARCEEALALSSELDDPRPRGA